MATHKKANLDYESLYYKAMKENVLLKNKTVPINMSFKEVEFLKTLLYLELIDVNNDKPLEMSEENEEVDQTLKNLKLKQDDDLLLVLIEEKKQMIENLIKKLIFEK